MSKLATVACAAALTFCAQAAAAAVVLDQASVPEAGVAFTTGVGYDFLDADGWGQSFTVGAAGVLDHIDIGLIAPWTPATAALTVKLTTMTGAVLFSQTYTPAAVPKLQLGVTDWSALFSVDVRAAAIAVAAGDKLRIGMYASAADQYGLVRQVNNSMIGYAGGELWRFKYLPGGVVWSENDTPFRTYVDTGAGGVPEPTTWALLILGFAAAGAALRRRPFVNVDVNERAPRFRGGLRVVCDGSAPQRGAIRMAPSRRTSSPLK